MRSKGDDKRLKFLQELKGQQFQQIRFKGFDAVRAEVSAMMPPSPEVQNKIEQDMPQRWYPLEGGGHLVRWPDTGSEVIGEGLQLEAGGWDHEHCDGCNRHIRAGQVFWQREQDPCYWLCSYCYRRLRQLNSA